ncbi:hypothetical protein [Marmoricola sp. RAF53]|uniref:hypothetical protein n=1 Tax=Marmoricola sp. RAF53 TaxID=3233059 RepID=UPI003F9B7710
MTRPDDTPDTPDAPDAPGDLPDGVPDFDDPVHDDVRALLADVRVTAPVPDAVAARIDAALAGLAPLETSTTVVPLRRHRSSGQRLLVAASVVGVVALGGIAVGNVLADRNGADDSASSTAAGDSGSASSPEKAPAGAAGSSTTPQATAADGSLPALTSAAFATGATRVLADDGKDLAYSGERSPAPQTSDLATLSSALGCSPSATPAPAPGGSSYAVLLDGRPALLVVSARADGHRIAEAFSCTGKMLARAVLD